MQRRKPWIKGALVALVLLAGAAGLWRYTRPQPVAVVLATIDRGDVQFTVSNTRAGSISACRRARLAPQQGGQIVTLNVREGDRVRAGQVLLVLWREDVTTQVQVASERERVAALQADDVCSRAEQASREAARMQNLWSSGAVSAEAVERSQTQERSLTALCSAAKADLEQSRASMRLAQVQTQRTILRAPFAGIVAEVTGEVGEYTTPSPPGIPTLPVVDLIDDSCLYVTAPIDEVDAAAVRVGMPAQISVDAMPGQRFSAEVRRIAPYVQELEKQARTVDIDVYFKDPADIRRLLVGYSADVEILIERRDSVLRVSTQALLEGNRVLIYRTENGMLEARTIRTGVSSWQFTEVLEGLSEGDRVVTSTERAGVQAGVRATPEGTQP
jgi:HlyD family secretion protein